MVKAFYRPREGTFSLYKLSNTVSYTSPIKFFAVPLYLWNYTVLLHLQWWVRAPGWRPSPEMATCSVTSTQSTTQPSVTSSVSQDSSLCRASTTTWRAVPELAFSGHTSLSTALAGLPAAHVRQNLPGQDSTQYAVITYRNTKVFVK